MNEILKPGKYYLGDPSDVLPSKIFNGIWGNIHNFESGKFIINNLDFVVHNTHYGDGIFKDTKNRSYGIETGVIALVHIDLIDDINKCKKKGHLFDFKDKVNFIYDAGVFYIRSNKKYIKIDTRNLTEYNSDYEEHCENEKGESIGKEICEGSDNDSIVDEDFNNSEKSDDDCEDEDECKTMNEEISSKKMFFKKKI